MSPTSKVQQARAAVLGSPIEHSKSPQLHLAAYQYLGVEIDYTRIEVDQSSAARFLSEQGAAAGWVGWSVTMPLKSVLVDHMSSFSERVRALGVLNTVTFSAGGTRLHGENTDVDGIVGALSQHTVVPQRFAVIGAGGTAAAALAAGIELGFDQTVIYARSAQRAQPTLELAETLGYTRASVQPVQQLAEDLATAERVPSVVVSTLPPHGADPVAELLPSGAQPPSLPILVDVAYDPWPSALATAWGQRDWPVVNGMDMLLHQAVKQVELFTAGSEQPAGDLSSTQHAQMVDHMRDAIGLKDQKRIESSACCAG